MGWQNTIQMESRGHQWSFCAGDGGFTGVYLFQINKESPMLIVGPELRIMMSPVKKKKDWSPFPPGAQ